LHVVLPLHTKRKHFAFYITCLQCSHRFATKSADIYGRFGCT
jgi:hypothetical protein